MARKLLLRQIRELKSLRKFSASSFLRKNEEFIIKSRLSDVVIPNMRLLDRLWVNFPSFQNHVAIKGDYIDAIWESSKQYEYGVVSEEVVFNVACTKECAETKKSYTYTQVRKYTSVFATSLLKKLGLKENDVVCCLLPNSPEFPIVTFGTIEAGCILSPINPVYKEIEISHQVTMTNPKVIVTITECYENVIKGLKLAKSEAKVVIVDDPSKPIPEGTTRYSELAETGDADFNLLDKIVKNNDDTALIPFSSGTTGLPKGVEISYKNLLAAMEVMDREENKFAILTNGDCQDVIPCILPFFHIYGIIITLIAHLINGCKLISMPRFSTASYFDILKNHNPSVLYLVPPIAILLAKHPDVTKDHFKNVRNIVCGAAPLSASDVLALLEKGNGKLEFNQGFGATETTSLATSTFKGTKNVDYSACGEPMASTELMFIDADGNPVKIGESGELCIRSQTIMKGYYKNEKAIKETMTDDGFFKTGDSGHFDPKHGLFVTDRIKELIKVKGMQVAPAELESILRSHPAVQDAAVIGVPHMFNGEVPKAFIIKKNGQNALAEDIQNFVAEKVASFKKIEEVVFVNDIPKTTSGKILRKELKKMYA